MRCLFAIVMSGSLCSANVTWAQMDKASAWTLEARVALNGSFGPSEGQAEIAGGRDTMSWDDKMHYTTGFLPSSATEIAIGYQRGALHHRLVLSYFLHEWGMSSPWGYPEVPLATADMLGIRLASALRLTGREDRWAYGFKTGLFISFTLPVSIIVEQAATDAFGLQAIHGDVQFNWGTEYFFDLPLGRKGAYAQIGTSITLPGRFGKVGTLVMEPGSEYTVVHADVGMYLINGWLGLGWRL